ncbi:MAG: Lrp/AsnC family transcriptional regulator [Muribaculaceae bacterium]|nr:Lrp/AsnC family transcriptional regulator [Muribaculaceae bacterium]
MPRQYFDKLDLTILNALCENARTPYLEIAREYGVSGAAVHQRVQRLIASNVITGSHCDIDPTTIGYHVVAFVGICAKPGTDIRELVKQLEEIEEITECNIVTGRYDLIVKMHARTNLDILQLVTVRMRTMPISNTETMVSFSEGFKRPLPIRNDK